MATATLTRPRATPAKLTPCVGCGDPEGPSGRAGNRPGRTTATVRGVGPGLCMTCGAAVRKMPRGSGPSAARALLAKRRQKVARRDAPGPKAEPGPELLAARDGYDLARSAFDSLLDRAAKARAAEPSPVRGTLADLARKLVARYAPPPFDSLPPIPKPAARPDQLRVAKRSPAGDAPGWRAEAPEPPPPPDLRALGREAVRLYERPNYRRPLKVAGGGAV